MKIFKLPDLGEGLADAEIREWHVKVGDVVKVDQALVCVETAKAVVEVPSPQSGTIEKLFGKVGDTINTGAPLVEFASGDVRKDGGSVVGSLEESSQRLEEGEVLIGAGRKASANNVKAMPAVRALAQQLNVSIDLVPPTGPQNQVTAEDVKKFASGRGGEGEILHGVRRAMAEAMTQSQQEIVPVTIIEDADITDLATAADVTVCVIQAIVAAVQAEPSLNAWYDMKNKQRRLFQEVNMGLAVDTAEGLFVPVLKDIANVSAKDLRVRIDEFKKKVKERSVSPSDLHGATFTLSNFGMIAGRYATPIIMPPMVAILACGKIRDMAAVHAGKVAVRRILPLSLSFDHRVVTGGEATRFLATLVKSLEGNHA